MSFFTFLRTLEHKMRHGSLRVGYNIRVSEFLYTRVCVDEETMNTDIKRETGVSDLFVQNNLLF
jgi:hypothetical protein